MIWVLEGPDGVGKSTLAEEIARQKDAHVIHCSFRKSWNMKEYHTKNIQYAKALDKLGINVVLDRWAPSEQVYGDVFRGGPRYGIMTMINRYDDENMTWIQVRNDKAAENHLKNKETRYEMFEDMAKISIGFDEFVKNTPDLNWLVYDYTKISKEEFVENL